MAAATEEGAVAGVVVVGAAPVAAVVLADAPVVVEVWAVEAAGEATSSTPRQPTIAARPAPPSNLSMPRRCINVARSKLSPRSRSSS